MKKLLVTTTGIIGSLIAANAMAADILGDATAEIVQQLEITQVNALNFGELTSSAVAGTAVASTGSATGGVTVLTPGNAAEFSVTGEPNSTYNIAVEPAVNLTNGVDSANATLTAPVSDITDGTGIDSFEVDGEIELAANQPSGTYTGTYNVSVNY
ncbi:MAG: hypothetical protein COV35_04240 [Alphaproteobacteria bacterium CG11_big_fil_rev_8_21_14_0_20_39_49]|nr:MAG: hypothetical protein COV35_04240 [Alphaproteobacteria bacterium CG11_big_fil_rev_8_21_14_0_20_39_49]